MKKLILLVTILFSSCGANTVSTAEKVPDATPSLTIMSNISQVLMHEPTNYTFLVDHGDNTTGQLQLNGVYLPVKIIRDVEENKPISITFFCQNGRTCKDIPSNFSRWRVLYVTNLTIHLHSAIEINGAGWTHGKQGKGETLIIK